MFPQCPLKIRAVCKSMREVVLKQGVILTQREHEALLMHIKRKLSVSPASQPGQTCCYHPTVHRTPHVCTHAQGTHTPHTTTNNKNLVQNVSTARFEKLIYSSVLLLTSVALYETMGVPRKFILCSKCSISIGK